MLTAFLFQKCTLARRILLLPTRNPKMALPATTTRGHPATENASGLTCHSSASGGNRHDELPFITISRPRRKTQVPKEGPEAFIILPLPLTPTVQGFRDPFGLRNVPTDVNLVVCKRFPVARTKQCARKSTAKEAGTCLKASKTLSNRRVGIHDGLHMRGGNQTLRRCDLSGMV